MLQLSQRPLLSTDADAALFVGRQREVELLQRAADLGFNALVLGDRGAGVTSLLHRVERTLRQAGHEVAYIDAGTFEGHHDDLLNLVARITPVDGAVVLLDGISHPSLVHTLFGQRRDELWELPHQWFVAGRTDRRSAYLEPPADAFFDAVVELDELTVDDATALLLRRAEAPGTEGEPSAEVVRLVAVALAQQVNPRTPRQLLAAARAVLLSGEEPSVIAGQLFAIQNQVASLGRPPTLLFNALLDIGPVSASDERLLDRLGWTRGRVVQVLKQLEEQGFVTAIDDVRGPGRPRKLYRAKRATPASALGGRA